MVILYQQLHVYPRSKTLRHLTKSQHGTFQQLSQNTSLEPGKVLNETKKDKSIEKKNRLHKRKVLTDNVASVKGTCTSSDRDKAFIPPILKPIKLPAHVILLASNTRWSLRTPFVTSITDVDRRCK